VPTWTKVGILCRSHSLALQHAHNGADDSGWRTAANWVSLGILYNTGQDCTAGSRVYVQDSIYDKFIEILVAKAKQLVIGDGFDEKSGGGPVVSFTLLTRVLRFGVPD
jgi:acyl-CoA reductase-like NAD-dependent aldehyde dehydrogenase